MSKLEQAARALLAHWDTPAWKQTKPTADFIADLREALAEQVDMNLNCKSVQKRLATVWGYVKTEQQKPMAIIEKEAGFETEVYATGYADSLPDGVFKLYAAPVRAKDLTDDEIYTLYSEPCSDREMLEFARAVIAADREKNK